MEAGGAGFSAAVTLIFGLFSWLQFPALCGFMFSSTRAGADNYRYSLYLGGMLAVVGLLSGLHALIRGPRGAMLIAGAVLNISFIVARSIPSISTRRTDLTILSVVVLYF